MRAMNGGQGECHGWGRGGQGGTWEDMDEVVTEDGEANVDEVAVITREAMVTETALTS